jgi:hypothetical protein
MIYNELHRDEHLRPTLAKQAIPVSEKPLPSTRSKKKPQQAYFSSCGGRVEGSHT